MAAKNPSMYGSSSSRSIWDKEYGRSKENCASNEVAEGSLPQPTEDRSVVVNVEATSSNTEHLFGPWMLVDTRRRRASLNKATPRVVECAKVWKDNSIGSRFLTLEVTTKIVLDTVNDEVGMTDTNVPSVVVLDIVTPSKMITVESLHIKEVDVVVIESNHRGQHTDILISDKTPQKTCSTSGKMAKLRVVSLEIPLLLPVDVLSKSSDRDKDVVPIVDGVKGPNHNIQAVDVGWQATSSRQFTIKFAYSLQIGIPHGPHDILWKTLQSFQDLQRIKTFLWLVCREQVMNNVERCRYHFALDSRCPRCNVVVEDLNHLIRFYPAAMVVWVEVIKADKFTTFLSLASIVGCGLMCYSKVSLQKKIGIEIYSLG
ncbi:hypothetical protein V6N13_148332 [Hibiscus sabdariffa]